MYGQAAGTTGHANRDMTRTTAQAPTATVRIGERRHDGLDLWVAYRVERSHVCASVVGQPARSCRLTKAQWATLTLQA